MNRNIMIVLAGGFLIAVLVALVVQASLSGGKKKTTNVASGETVKIVVAAKSLSTGDELNEKNIKFQSWPKDAVFDGAIRQKDGKKPDELVKGTLRRAVTEGEPIMKSALVPEEKYNYLAASLAPGMRAFSVKFTGDDLVGGFIKPGDHVDVLLTYKSKMRYKGKNPEIENMIEANLNNKVTETILQNLKIIAVGQDIERVEDDGNGDGDSSGKNNSGNKKKAATKTVKSAVVTFEVDRKSAEILAVADDFGKLSLALRKLGDETILAERPPSTTDARVTNIYDELLEKVHRMEKSSSQAGNIVRIYSGVDIEEVTVGQ